MFFGEFVEGLEHGRGVHTNLNFSFFDGVWVDGRRDGAGVFFPPPEDREAKVRLVGDAWMEGLEPQTHRRWLET